MAKNCTVDQFGILVPCCSLQSISLSIRKDISSENHKDKHSVLKWDEPAFPKTLIPPTIYQLTDHGYDDDAGATAELETGRIQINCVTVKHLLPAYDQPSNIRTCACKSSNEFAAKRLLIPPAIRHFNDDGYGELVTGTSCIKRLRIPFSLRHLNDDGYGELVTGLNGPSRSSNITRKHLSVSSHVYSAEQYELFTITKPADVSVRDLCKKSNH